MALQIVRRLWTQGRPPGFGVGTRGSSTGPLSVTQIGRIAHDCASGEQVSFSAHTAPQRTALPLSPFKTPTKTQGWLDADPLVGLKRRPQTRGEPRALDPAQVEALLRGIHNVRDRALF